MTIVGSTREADDFLVRIGAEESVIGRFPSRHSREARAFMLAAEEDTVGTPWGVGCRMGAVVMSTLKLEELQV